MWLRCVDWLRVIDCYWIMMMIMMMMIPFSVGSPFFVVAAFPMALPGRSTLHSPAQIRFLPSFSPPPLPSFYSLLPFFSRTLSTPPSPHSLSDNWKEEEEEDEEDASFASFFFRRVTPPTSRFGLVTLVTWCGSTLSPIGRCTKASIAVAPPPPPTKLRPGRWRQLPLGCRATLLSPGDVRRANGGNAALFFFPYFSSNWIFFSNFSSFFFLSIFVR